MKKIQKKLVQILFLIMAFAMLFIPETVKAENATVTFGSASYRAEKNGEFWVGVYIRGESNVGTYRVEIEYDSQRLEYIGGAEQGENGIIVLEGTGLKEQVKYMLSFKCLSGGEAYLKVKNAVVNMGDSNNAEAFTLTELGTAPITISGDDTVGETSTDSQKETPAFETDIPHIEPAIVIDGAPYYVMNLAEYMPESMNQEYQTETLQFMDQSVTFLTNNTHNVYYTYLIDKEEGLHFYAYNHSTSLFYPCEVYSTEDECYYCTSPYVCNDWPEALSLDIIRKQNIVYAMDLNGNGDFYHTNQDGEMVKWDEEEGEKITASQMNKLIVILAIAIVVIILILLFVLYTNRELERKKRKLAKQKNLVKIEELEPTENKTDQIPKDQSPKGKVTAPERPGEKPVISVQDVTMRFKISTSNASGIKEYLIQFLKRQISFRELLALDHVSFDVYKGEVVGIIGTNGSGKSTILRIVSGALNPTEGPVEVDRRKVQLLTLGTGFDMELTAKENVYLNGAIIGYTEAFINEHYDEIVEFAELEGFMEEKVKNFSSGMVSRLGFAIATVGEAAEILILDEVLSVGDEFFRKKSLKRVKEMIHGGSTVLMVSHSMNTIMENCSKVIWIEKGVLKMVGEPKEVCAAYRKQQE